MFVVFRSSSTQAGRYLPVKAKQNMAALKAQHDSFVDEQQQRAIENSKEWKNIVKNQKHVIKEVGFMVQC
eukprot:814531-Pyramimonas_sp.AAC.2